MTSRLVTPLCFATSVAVFERREQDARPILDATETLARFQRMLDDHVADDDPAPSGCSEEVLEPLRAARARANEILLGE